MKTIYTEKELMEMLGIKETTMRKYRKEGYIGYSLVGDKYWYSDNDIQEFLLRNHHTAFNCKNSAA